MAPGDIVILKSGGPRMTVYFIREGFVHAKWFTDAGELIQDKFVSAMLKIVESGAEDE